MDLHNMSKRKYIIDNILNGISPSFYLSGSGQYGKGLAIDPSSEVSNKPSGAIFPVKFSTITTTNINAAPLWILNTPITTKVYVYLANGKFISFSSALGSETLEGTATSSSGNGAAYYNDYIYLATNTDVSRWGPLSGAAALTNSVWTGATLGTQAALTNTSYPANIPNHPMHVHVDNQLYFGDYASGAGIIHSIKTTSAGVNNGSAFNVLDLPFGYKPTDIESYGLDLAILATKQSTDTTLRQGESALFLWDTISETFYRQVPINDALATSLLNNNGRLYIGHSPGGTSATRWSEYLGGYTVEPRFSTNGGRPPFAGAVDAIGEREVFAGNWFENDDLPVVYAYGYNNPELPQNAVNAIIQTSGTQITSLKYYRQASSNTPQLLAGFSDFSSTHGLASYASTGGGGAIFYSGYINVGAPFVIKKISFNLTSAISSGVTITPAVIVDNNYEYNNSNGLDTINTTNFPATDYANGRTRIELFPTVNGEQGFEFRLTFAGTTSVGISLPVIFEVHIKDDGL